MATFTELRTPRDYTAIKLALYQALADVGFIGTWNWQSGSVPSSFLEQQARSAAEYEAAQKVVVEGGLNSTAEEDALTAHSSEVYLNERTPGRFTIGQVLLTDSANAGPFKFSPTSVSFSVGKGGLRYDGIGTTQLTLPAGGTVRVDVQSAGIGVEYAQVAVGAINFFARGALSGVTVTNDAAWLTGTGAQQGTSDESDLRLRERNSSQWQTLGTGSPARAYENWALDADPQVTRVAVYSNLDILQPGTVNVILAGSAGAVGAGVVLNVQNAIATAQIGGTRIPETARCVASSAVNQTITLSGTVYLQREVNQSAFQAQVAADVGAFGAALPIGGLVSWERLLSIVAYRAGLSPGTVLNIDNFAPAVDTQLAYDRVAVLSVAGLTYVSV